MVDTRAPKELEPDDRLLQENKTKVKTKRGVQTIGKQENNSPTSNKGGIIILFFLTLDQGTIAPAEKGQKYSVKDKNKQQKDRAY